MFRRWRRREILNRLAERLAPGGLLVIGVGEVADWHYPLLEPVADLKAAELAGDNTTRLALTEEYKSYPLGAVWDYYCLTRNVPVRGSWLAEVKKYEADVLSKR